MKALIFTSTLIISGCNTLTLPSTIGEEMGAATYIPFDPLPTQTLLSASCTVSQKEIDVRKISDVFVESI
jgi:hypothetical protein